MTRLEPLSVLTLPEHGQKERLKFKRTSDLCTFRSRLVRFGMQNDSFL